MKFIRNFLIMCFFPIVFLFGGNRSFIEGSLIKNNNNQKNFFNLDGFYLKNYYPSFLDSIYVYTDGTRDVAFNLSYRNDYFLSSDEIFNNYFDGSNFKPIDLDLDGEYDDYEILDIQGIGSKRNFYILAREIETDKKFLFSWGENRNGQLGNGEDFFDNFTWEFTKVSNSDLDGNEINFNNIKQIETSHSNLFIVVENGIDDDQIYILGGNQFNELGIPSSNFTKTNKFIPLEWSSGRSIGEIKTSSGAIYVSVKEGEKNLLYVWGTNRSNNFGDPNFSNDEGVIIPALLDADANGKAGDENVIDFGVGVTSSLLLLEDKDGTSSHGYYLYTSGEYSGTGQAEEKRVKLDVDGDGDFGDEKIKSINSSYYFHLVEVDNEDLEKTSTVYNWGSSSRGELGNGSTSETNIPEKIDINGDGISGNEKIISIKYSQGSTIIYLKDSYGISSFYGTGTKGSIDGTSNYDSSYVKNFQKLQFKSFTGIEFVENDQESITFKFKNDFLLNKPSDWGSFVSDISKLKIIDTNDNVYEIDFTNFYVDETFKVLGLDTGTNYFFKNFNYDDEEFSINDESDIDIWNKDESFITDYKLNGFSVLNTSKTSANLKFDVTTTNFGAYSDQERTININYDYEQLDEGGTTISSGSGTLNNAIIDKSGELFIEGLTERTDYTITSIEYNNSYSLAINSTNGEVIETKFESLYLVNETFEIDEITKNSLKFSLNVFDEGAPNFINEYNFIYLFFKNDKGGDSPLIAYRLNDGSGSGEEKTYQFEVRNLSSGIEYELLGLSLDKNFGSDGEGNDESFVGNGLENIIIETDIDEVESKGYIYIILIIGTLLFLVFILFVFLFIKNIRKNKELSKASKEMGV